MSLGGLTALFSLRLDEARDAIATLVKEESSQLPGSTPLYSPEYRRLAGCCWVLLYAALEFGVSRATRLTLQSLAASGVHFCDVVHPIYAVVLDGEFESAATVKSARKWNARLGLLEYQQLKSAMTVNDSVFDSELQMTNIKVMRLVFDAFGIPDPVVPDPSMMGYIEEIKDKRNAVAHGRESASAVGAGITSGDLSKRCDVVNQVVNHYIAVLDAWLLSKTFIKAASRHMYP
jgi:hypothetical protein